MTEGLAIEIAAAKMGELGINRNYLLRLKCFMLPPSGEMILKNHNDLFILIHPNEHTKVFSPSGIYDETDEGVTDLQFVFTGKINVTNLNGLQRLKVKFLQVIPTIESYGRSHANKATP